ncbi:MAG: type III-A CRISPR-associated RAMP protein Csm3 [Chloroflexota bacterium]|jgi:CRISPR-associated protein Csm3
MDKQIQLYGRVFIEAHIKAITGLHIGGSNTDLEIGGLDKAVIRNPLTKRPYIPGSSLRGKMRSQMEKLLGLPQNRNIGQVTIHTCKTKADFEKNGGCPVCTVFGVPAEMDYNNHTRLVVRDAELTDDSAQALIDARTDLLYGELKTEVAIDRVTSAATPRTLERVPAGAVFGPAELVFGVYEAADFARLKVVTDALQLVEDDYIGGAGSRGSGKVKFEGIQVYVRNGGDYSNKIYYREQPFESVQELAKELPKIQEWLKSQIAVA